jgi:lysophospholipase L1-like esterase
MRSRSVIKSIYPRRRLVFSLLLVPAILLMTSSAQAQASSAALPPVRIILVGDSTMAVNSGWGTGFCADVVREAACVNMAKGGRSSSSYRAEGSWANVMEALKHNHDYKATYVLIQFGHNDQPGKPGRSTDLATEFPVNMKRYVDEVAAADGTPVLVTPLTRRQFKDGKLVDGLGPWADAVKQVAATAHVRLLDLHGDSLTAVQKMGPAEADTLAQAPPPIDGGSATGTSIPAPAPSPTPQAGSPSAEAERKSSSPPRFDYTHLGEKGAAYFGRMIATELTQAVPELQPYVIQPNVKP